MELIPNDQLKNLAMMTLCYPMGTLFRKIPYVKLRYLFTILLSLGMGMFCFKPIQLVHPVFTTLLTYLMMKMSRHYAPYYSMVFNLTYLSFLHLDRQYNDYLGWTLDITGPMMMSTLKLIALTYNYRDGKNCFVTELRSDLNRLKKLPSLLSVFAYVFYFPGFLAGPTFEYKEFIKHIKQTDNDGCYNHYYVLFKSTIWIPFILITNRFIPYIITPEFGKESFLYKIGYSVFVAFLLRAKYYFIWTMTRGAFISTGFEKPGTESMKNIDIWKIEWPENITSISVWWNIRTGQWLRNYVYLRFKPDKNGRQLFVAQIVTYTVSAFWHGFYPGYYFTFIFIALVQDTSKAIRRKFLPVIEDRYRNRYRCIRLIYDLLGRIGSLIIISTLAIPFVLLSYSDSLLYLQNMSYLPVIITLSAFVIVKNI